MTWLMALVMACRKLKRNGCNKTRRSVEQRAGFLRKWSCAAKQSTALRSVSNPLPTRPRTVPNPDRLIRAPFNNRDYGRYAQTLFCGLRRERSQC